MGVTIADVEEIHGPVSEAQRAKTLALITYITSLIELEACRSFTSGQRTILTKVDAGMVYLAYPMHVVTVTFDGFSVAFEQITPRMVKVGAASHALVKITGTADGVMPDVVKGRIVQIVTRSLNVSAQALAGVSSSSETTGPVTDQISYAAWAVGGDVVLSPDDKDFARKLRPKRYGHTWVIG